MRLTKHHGLGNDFLVLADPSGLRPPDPALALAACDRHRGIGADGLLFLGRGRDDAHVSMVLINADGSRAEMSGNGIGCLVQAAVLAGLAPPPVVTVATDAGLRSVEIVHGEAARTHVATVGMGPVEVGDDEPEWVWGPILRAVRVSVGNPHLVLQAAEAELLEDRSWIEELGRRANAAIPGGINVEVVAAGDGELHMDVYERGVGLTLACGTGACATAAASRRWGLCGPQVVVRMAGGPTSIDLAGPDVRMTTPIVHVGTVEYTWP
ncbi:MAG: diaminopimelate epimerase [Acidimicrobiia bacterium]|nr:diaminopimelate epimerase [Acidimicrobiia bacterium]